VGLTSRLVGGEPFVGYYSIRYRTKGNKNSRRLALKDSGKRRKRRNTTGKGHDTRRDPSTRARFFLNAKVLGETMNPQDHRETWRRK